MRGCGGGKAREGHNVKALAVQIGELDGTEIYGRMVGVRGLMVEVAGPLQVMERAIAERRRHPAINLLKSVSRTMPRSADPAYLSALTRARQVMATYADMEELIWLGAYRAGTSAEVDEAIRLHKPLEDFPAQSKEEATSLAEGYRRLAEIVTVAETER